LNKSEVAKLLAFVTALYPNIDVKRGTVEAWHEMVGDLPYNVVKNAMKKVLAEQHIPCLPAAGKIREAAAQITHPRVLSSAEAWGQVMAAVQKYGYYQAVEGMQALNPVVRQTVKAFGGFTEICLTENIDATRAHFLKMYEQYAMRKIATAVMPDSVRQLTNRTAGRLTGA